FDGHSFEVLDQTDSLFGRKVRAITEDDLGNIWLGSEAGLNVFDGKHMLSVGKALTKKMQSPKIRSLIHDGSKMWIATLGKGLFSWDGENFINYGLKEGLPDLNIRTLALDQNNTLWIGTDSGLASLSNKEADKEITTYGVAEGMQPRMIITLFCDSKNNIWVGTERGVLKYKDNTFYFYTPADGLIHPRVRAISEDLSGNIWLGTMDGASRFDGITFENFTEDNGLPYNRIRDIEKDHQGNLWFATYFGGASCFTDKAFSYYNESDGLLGDVVESVVVDNDGEYLLGTWGGLNVIKNNSIKQIDTLSGLLSSTVTALEVDAKTNLAYIAYDKPGLSIYDKRARRSRALREIALPAPLNELAIDQVLSDRFDRLWVLGENGITYILNKKRFSILPITNRFENIESHQIYLDSKNFVWIGSRNNIVRVDSLGNTREFIADASLGEGRILRIAC
ncbi:MAG: ligand-binding sensor domain-containing protein, partial [Limisphaerales bacterium]